MKHSQPIEEDSIQFNGHSIFYRYRKGTSRRAIVLLHGYPTSSLDYVEVMKQIPEEYTLVAHDHLGFGRSDKPSNNEYLLTEQADIALSLYKVLGLRSVHIVAHDYGTSVTTELIRRHFEKRIKLEIQSVTLCNGSMLIDMSQLRPIQKLLKHKWFGKWVAMLTSESTFQRNMKNIWFDKEKYSREEMKAHWHLLIQNGGRNVLPKITQYIDQRYTHYDRWIGGLRLSRLPMHILWAENDPVAVVAMATELDKIIKNSSLTIIHECGHYPMLEKTAEWTNSVVDYIDEIEQISRT